MAIAVAAITILCGSCSAIRTTGSQPEVKESPAAAGNDEPGSATGGSRSKRKKSKTRKKKETPQQFAATQIKLSEQLLSGRWNIYSVDDNEVQGTDELWPYIDFSVNENRFYGSNGCNYINGTFEVKAGQLMTLGNIITSLMACPDDEYGADINKALNHVSSYSLEQRGNEYFLHLHNSKHATVLTLRKHNLDFLNGAWKVVEMEGIACADKDMRMVIDIPEHRIHGNTGCNILNGYLSEDPAKPNSIQFHEITTTRMACKDLATETAFLIALEEAEFARKATSGDKVELYDKRNRTVLILEPIKR